MNGKQMLAAYVTIVRKEFLRMFPHHAESMRSLSAIRSYMEVTEQESKQRGFLLYFELDEGFGLKVTKAV